MYSALAVILLNVVLAFATLNVALFAGFWVYDRFSPASNAIAERYGATALADIYPDLDARAVDVLLDETWTRSTIFEPYVMFREAETHGTYVNVHPAGFRISRDQGAWPPADATYNVFLFGGSTTFSYGLPDNQSLGSYLQESLETVMQRDVAVYNFGMGGYQSTQERLLFQELLVKGHKPELAIFVDGLNEFEFPYVPMGTDQLQRMLEDTPVRRFLWLSGAIFRRLPIMRLIDNDVPEKGISPLDVDGNDANSETPQQELLNAVVGRYLANKRMIEATAQQFNIRSVFVWQPIPYYKYDRRYHPFSGTSNGHAQPGYEHMRRVVDSQDMGSNFLWCADMQEGMQERLYVDSVHHTAKLSRLLAEYIAERMAERQLL
jgi:hypothetical protein